MKRMLLSKLLRIDTWSLSTNKGFKNISCENISFPTLIAVIAAMMDLQCAFIADINSCRVLVIQYVFSLTSGMLKKYFKINKCCFQCYK